MNEQLEISVKSARSHPIRSRWHSAFGKVVAPWLAALAFISPGASAGSSYPFVPEAFNVPPVLEADTFRLRMLTVNDVIKDYDAVMSSAAHIRSVWPDSGWPAGLTLEQNLIDLGWHQREFQRRTSFAYTVVSLDESRVVGCVYINPTRKAGYDAEVFLWTRPPEQVSNISQKMLKETVTQWLAKEWPFNAPAFPGIDIPWTDWAKIAEFRR